MAQKKTPNPSHNSSLKFKPLASSERILSEFKKPSFKKKLESQQFTEISQELYKLIKKEKAPCFLLPAISSFIDKVNQSIKPNKFTFAHFEFWLNQISDLNDEENYDIRSKIVGKKIAREDYQQLFPIGMNKVYPGSHYISAHGSPDLDTTISSFWGWVDAFGARVSQGLHIWNVPPGGILSSKEAAPLTDVFEKSFFDYFSMSQMSLSPASIDYTNHSHLIKKNLHESMISPEDHERHKNALMVVDEDGFYIGDIRSEDYESIRQIMRLVTNNLKWFESSINLRLVELFSKLRPSFKLLKEVLSEIFSQKMIECVNRKQLTQKLHDQVDQYLKKVFLLPKGFESNYNELATGLKKNKLSKLEKLEINIIQAFKKNQVFDAKGHFLENRPKIFKALHEISQLTYGAIQELQTFMETFSSAIRIKREVFNFAPRYVTPIATLDEISSKMNVLNHLSVVLPLENGKFWPLGIIKAQDLKEGKYGTVSLRDFCNRSEVNIDSNLEIISVIDHHKTDLKTKMPPLSITGDVQSCNVLVAEQAFIINDKYNKGYTTKIALNKQLSTLSTKTVSDSLLRIQNRVMNRILAHSQPDHYFIHPQREYFEYLSFLHAIIDDTDLFSKATKRDVYCVASLLNRMVSIEKKREVEIISFDKLKDDPHFVKNAVKEILMNTEMYRIYKEIFSKREKGIESSIVQSATKESSDFFSDVKEQNGCCRISQSKIFRQNVKTFDYNYEKLLTAFFEKAEEVYSNHELLDLHMHMVSTIPSAEDVHSKSEVKYTHRDYLWLWTSQSNQAINHLTVFLNAFKNSPKMQRINMQIQILGQGTCDYENILKHHFIDAFAVKKIKVKKKMPVIILSFDAGTLNSRKADITPYLPTLVK